MSSNGLPEVLMKKVDDYVDSLAPQIQPRIASELELFQQKTIDSLETQIIDAFRSLFNKDKPDNSDGSRGPWNLNDAAPNSYGGLSLPFADEIAKLTRSFDKVSDEAGDDLRDIFSITEGGGNSNQERSQNGERSFLSSAINFAQERLEQSQGQGAEGFEIGGLLGVISNTVKDASRNPEEKARLISPEIKDRVGEKLRSQHANIAEQFTKIALDHIKRWLRGNTSSRDLGDGAKAEFEDQVKGLVKGLGGLFGSKKSSDEGDTRGFDAPGQDRSNDEGGGGFSQVLSDKLSTGLAKVHREVRLDFRRILGEIEKQLFELLPDQFQRPLEKILGGNPFDSQLDRDASSQADRGFGDDIKAKLVSKIRDLIEKVQETLRESVLGVVNGGHRKFERESWLFVHNMVEQKVQRYLPDVKINVPDDIGNENVSVGDPSAGSQLGGGHSMPTTQSEHHQNPSQPGYDAPSHEQGGYNDRPQHQPSQGYQNEPRRQDQQYQPPQYSQQQYPPQQYQDQGYQSPQYRPTQDNYPQQNRPPQGYSEQEYSRSGNAQRDYQSRY